MTDSKNATAAPTPKEASRELSQAEMKAAVGGGAAIRVRRSGISDEGAP